MLWVKALHIISVVCWFAGLFYLPRLFVYHAMSEDEISQARFKVMERKLYYGIMTPSMLATFIFGMWQLMLNGWAAYQHQGWMHLKLALVFLLIVYHHVCKYHLKRFALDQNTKSHTYFRWFNEFPVIILFAVVILVVVRPTLNT